MSRLFAAFVLASSVSVASAADEPVVPKEMRSLFNGKNLDGLTSWLKESKREDPK